MRRSLAMLLHRDLAVASLALLVVALAVPTARAQVAANGTFSITPSRRDLVGRPPVTLLPTRVSNTTQQTYDVRVFPVLLHQNLSGAFQFAETPIPLGEARMILGVSPSQFQLAPGRSREVALRWELLRIRAREAYIGIIFQGQARIAGGGSVPVITRLLSINFLRLPGQYRSNGAFTALPVIQFAPHVIRILPRVKNTGDVVDSPQHARLAITDSAGRTVYRAPFTADVILPRAEREFPIDVQQALPAGSYMAHAVMSFGATRRAVISSAFTLTGPNQLTAPAVEISDFAAHGEVGRPALITGRVHSTGTTPANVDLTVSLSRVIGGLAETTPLTSKLLHFAALAPGTTRALRAELAKKLADGHYHVLAQYTDPTGASQQLTSDFAAVHRRSFVDRLRLYFDRNAPLIIGAIALIAVAILVFILVRRQRRLEAELRRVKAEQDR